MAQWDWQSLWLKAKTLIDKAQALGHNDPDFGLWSALSLETLARAALSKVHPALNADVRDERNLLYAFGYPVVEQPRSLPAHSVFARLQTVVTGFEKPHKVLCDYVSLRRNIELHTGDPGFVGIGLVTWLPQFYVVCKLLCDSLGKSLADFLGPDNAEAAQEMIDAFATAQQKSVVEKVAAHRKAFEERPPEERDKLKLEAEARTRMLGAGLTQRTCPACGSPGVLRGKLIKEFAPIYDEGLLLVDQQYLAEDFRCPACGLHLSTVAEITHAGLDLQFMQQSETDLHERFQPEAEDDYMNM